MALNEESKKGLSIAQNLAREYRNETFGPAHILLGILHNEVGLATWLVSKQKDIHYLRDWAEIRIEEYPKSIKLGESPNVDKEGAAVLEFADLIALQLNHDWVDPVSLLIALVKPNLGFTADQLKTLPLIQKELISLVMEDDSLDRAIQPKEGKSNSGESNTVQKSGSGSNILKYCVDKTDLAREGKLDPIIGRDRELRMMIEVLGRRTKPNVILVGEPGVGKTALIEGFAQVLIQGKVPKALANADLLELDTGALVAGASYKGEIEDRIKNILKELKQKEKAILFIDEIHMLLDSKGSIGTGVVNLLKPELARGEITLIGATTIEEYRKYMESDEAFARRFEIVKVEEPDVETAIHMLQNIVPLYESFHELKVDSEAIREAVVLAKRYSKDRRLPDSAVDLMDRTLASLKMMSDTSLRELDELSSKIGQFNLDSGGLLKDQLDLLNWHHKELKDKINPILMNRLDEALDLENIDLEIPSEFLSHLKESIQQLKAFAEEKRDSMTKSDIAAIVSYKTGIPLGKIQSKEREKLLTVEEVLKKRVIGQDHAIKAVSEAILESRSGLIKAGQPIGSFFFLGPTGTGKTELAKSLADFLFNNESFLIRFDMSEFKEEHSAALLYGAPPGYVGYEEGGMLVNKIREKPYSVVLFDEIEKAHPSVFDTFLQILDEGKLHDRLGKEGDFSNAIILFTSNIGSKFISEKFVAGEIPKSTDLMEVMAPYFRPEFLARLTEIVPFAPITQDNALKIFDIHLKSLTDPLSKQGIRLELSENAKKNLVLSGFNQEYGARQIKGVIRNQLRRPISRMIVKGQLKKGSLLKVDLKNGEMESDLEWNINDPLNL